MQYCTWTGLGLLLLPVVYTALGCSETTQTSGSKAIVKWNDIRTMVVEIQEPEGVRHYILKGGDSTRLSQSLRDNTVAESSPSRTTQMLGGTNLRVFAFSGQGEGLHRFWGDFQYVEGMGDKRRPNPKKTHALLEGQRKRCSAVLNLVDEIGRPLTKAEFDEYAKQVEGVDYMFLYWRN